MTDIVVRLRLWGDSYHLHKESADEIEKLRAELQSVRRDALEEAARLVNQTAGVLSNPSAKDVLNYVANAIRALGEKE